MTRPDYLEEIALGELKLSSLNPSDYDYALVKSTIENSIAELKEKLGDEGTASDSNDNESATEALPDLCAEDLPDEE